MAAAAVILQALLLHEMILIDSRSSLILTLAYGADVPHVPRQWETNIILEGGAEHTSGHAQMEIELFTNGQRTGKFKQYSIS